MRYSDHKVIALIIITGFLLLMTTSAMAIGPGDGNLLKRSVEETCHACHKTYKNAPTDPDAIKSHSSTDTTKWPSGWGIPNGKYGEIVCTTCHTPHDTKNIYLIREKITAPNAPTDQFPGSTVDLRYLSGTAGGDTGYYALGDDTACYEASYTDQATCQANGGTWNSVTSRCNYPSLMDQASCTGAGHEWLPRTTSTRVCEVCHSKNKYHNYDSNNNTLNGGDFTHNNAGDCTACHPHSAGFTPAGGACNSCHGNPPTVNTLGGPDGLAKYPDNSGTGSNNAGKHEYHATSSGLNLSCNTCHTNYVMPENSLKRIQIGFNIFGVGGGSYDGQTGVAYEGKNGTTVSNTGTRQCSNIYCHSSVQGAGGTGSPTYATPQWLDTATAQCGTCHKADGLQGNGTLMDSGSHTKHVASPYSKPCSECHNGAGSGTAVHVNNNINMAFVPDPHGNTGYYSQSPNTPGNGYGSCSNVYCHSIVQTNGGGPLTSGTSQYKTVTWGTAVVCGNCHSIPPYSTGAHQRHADPMSYGFACSVCHNNGGYSGGTPTANHANKNIEIAFDPNYGATATYSQDPNPPGNGYGTCSTTYCHSNGTGGTLNPGDPRSIAANTSPIWSGTTNCGSCHGGGNATGQPNYANGTPKANSHAKHPTDCSICHYATTTDGTTITDTSKHVNRLYDLVAKTGYSFSYSYQPTGGSCSSISCHGNAQWGGPSQTCVSCHSAALGNRRQITATDSSPSGTGDVYTGTTGGDFIRPSRHVSNGTTTQYISKWDCIVCHMEGDPTTGGTSSLHTGTPGSNADVNLRNVDNYTTGWVWNRFGTIDTVMRNNMDRFCLSCHDSDASADTLITLEPNGAGTTSGWTYQGGASNYYNLSTDDGDTTRIQTTTNNAIHLFNLDDPDTSFISDVATVASVTVKAVARLNATGDDQIKLVVRTGGTNYFSSAITLTGGTTYTTYSATWTTNPGGGSWTGAQIRALEAGVQYIQVGGTATQINVTQLWVEVDFGSLNPDIGTGTKLVWGTNLGGASTIAVNSTNNGLLLGTAVSRRMTPWNTNATYRNTYEYSTIKTERNNRGMTIPDVRGDFNSQGLKGKGWASHHNLNIFPKRYWTNNTTYLPTGVWTSYVTKEGQTLNDPNVGVTAGLHCSDCHLNEVNAHGSVNTRYMLSDMNGNDAAYTNGVLTTATHVCAKCHNRAVYADDSSATDSQFPHQDMCQNPASPTDPDYPTATHLGNRSSAGDGNSGFGSNLPCLACHGGVDFGSIHGSNAKYVPGGQAGITKRYRFMSGGAMRFFRPGATTPVTDSTWEETGTAGIACYTLSAADNFGSCTQHSGGRSENQTRQRLLEY